jgi:hypothetical protein
MLFWIPTLFKLLNRLKEKEKKKEHRQELEHLQDSTKSQFIDKFRAHEITTSNQTSRIVINLTPCWVDSNRTKKPSCDKQQTFR